MALPTRTRRRGLRLNPEAFERALAERLLESQDLARLADLSPDTIVKVRRGQAVDRATLAKVADALKRAPIDALLAGLVRPKA